VRGFCGYEIAAKSKLPLTSTFVARAGLEPATPRL
jgi:hypothetical protein